MDHKDKLYYSIGEVAKLFDVNTSLIRFWEKEFDILKPKKNKKGNRLFTPKDVDNLYIIFDLVKEKKFTLQGAKEYMAAQEKAPELNHQEEIVKTLLDTKEFLLKLKASL
jgi:DNA-binding transcriptional MerR regulator